MKAILVEEGSKNLYLGKAETPSITGDEILVKVKATALNRADLLQKRGLYPPPEGASPILGLEMSGVIEEIGENVKGWKKGSASAPFCQEEDMRNMQQFRRKWQCRFRKTFHLLKLRPSLKYF